jgi:glycogen debranching enzyme
VLDRLTGEADVPFPSRSLLEPVAPGDGTGMLIGAVEANLPPRWRNRPGRYHNGAVWPYIGGFHAAASAVRSSVDQAWSILERVAAANALDGWSFPEWIALDGTPNGARHQTWNAGAFLYGLAACRGAGGPGVGR